MWLYNFCQHQITDYVGEIFCKGRFFLRFWPSNTYFSNPVDTGLKLNVHKTFRRRPGRPVSTGLLVIIIIKIATFYIWKLYIGKIISDKFERSTELQKSGIETLYVSSQILRKIFPRAKCPCVTPSVDQFFW